MIISFFIKMFHILVLCRVLLVISVQTLTIDSQLGTSIEDCFERISIGEQLPSDAIYRNVSELSTRECEQICKQDKQCQAYDYGVGAKGNATCNLSNNNEKELKEKSIPKRHPDYDVYVRRVLCEQSPPTPIQTQFDDPGDLPLHRPVFRPDDDEAKRPLSDDYLVSSNLPQQRPPFDERPDDYNNHKPDFDSGPSYGAHRPQDIPYRPGRPERPSLNQSYNQQPDPYDVLQFQDPYGRPRPPHYGKPETFPYPINDTPDIYGPRPHPYIPEKPEYHYIIRPNRKPQNLKPQQDTGYGQTPIRPQEDTGYGQRPSPQGGTGYGQRPLRPHEDTGYGQRPTKPQEDSGYGHKPIPQGDTGYGQRPLRPQEDSGYGQKPIPQEDTGYGQRPLRPQEDTGYGQRPTRPQEDSGYGQKPIPQGDTGYGQRPSRPQEDTGYGQRPTRPQEDSGYGQKPIPQGDTGYGHKPSKPDTSYGIKPDPHRPDPIPSSGPMGPPDRPYRPNRPYEKPNYSYNNQYASNYGQNNDNYIYLEINDPPRPYKPIKDRPYGQQYEQGIYGYGSYSSQNSYSQSHNSQSQYYGTITEIDNHYNRPHNDHRPGYDRPSSSHHDSGYSASSSGYGSPTTHKPNDYTKPSSSNQGSYGSNQEGYGSQTSGYGSQVSQKPIDPINPAYGAQDDYGSQTSGYGSKPTHKPSKPSYGDSVNDPYNKPAYGSNQGSYGSNQGYFSSQSDYSSSQSSYGGSSQYYGTSNRPSYDSNRPDYDSHSGSYGSQKPNDYPKPSYGSDQGAYGSGQGGYGSGQGGYGSNQGSYGGSQNDISNGSYGSSNRPSYGTHDDFDSHGGYGKPAKPNDPYKKPHNQGGYGSNQSNYGSNQSAYGSSQQFDSQSSHNSQSYGSNQGTYGSNQGTYGSNQGNYGSDAPGYGNQNSDKNQRPGYGNERPVNDSLYPSYIDVKPVYEYESDKPSDVPSYIARPGGDVVTSRPMVIGDYGDKPGYGREPGHGASYKACFRRVLAGQRALRSHVRKVVPCERLEDCRRECAIEDRFNCESFNYKLDPSFRGKGLCELMVKPIEAFDLRRDFVEDKDYDFYERDRNSLEPNCPESLRGPGLLHSGYLSSKPNLPGYQTGWTDRSDWDSSRYHGHQDRFQNDRRGMKNYGNRRYEDEIFVPYQIGVGRSSDNKENWGKYGGIYGGDNYYKDRNDYHKSINHWRLASDVARPHGVKTGQNTDFDYHSLGKKDGWDDRRYAYGSWKRGRWNNSGGSTFNGLDYGESNYYKPKPLYYEPIERSEEPGGKDCSSRRRPGMSLGSGAIRRSLIARNVVECEAACFSEREFKCVSYSYRYSNSHGTDNCFLSERPYRGLELSADSGSDVYAMPQDQGCSIINHKPWVESECFWHVRSGAAVSNAAVRAALTVAGLGACEAECIRAHAFFCRGFSFRFDSPTIGDDLENCILTSSPPTSLETGHGLKPNNGHELYSRGNYGRGCEPALYDDVQHRDRECYLQYDSAAKLTGSAIRGEARVTDEMSCGAACTDAPFRCLSFSFNNNAPPESVNCLLSEIRLFDLQKGVDYVHSTDDWLFSFDLFNGQCWRKVHGKGEYEEPSPELPRPIPGQVDEPYPASGPSGSGYLPEPAEISYIPGSGPPSGPGYKPYPSGPEIHKPGYLEPSGPSFKPNYPGSSGSAYKPGYLADASGTGYKPGYLEPSGPSYKPAYLPETSSPNFKPNYPGSSGPSYKPGYIPETSGPGYISEVSGPGYKPGYLSEPSGPGYKPGYPEPSGPSYKPPTPSYKPFRPGYETSYPAEPNRPGYRPVERPDYKPGYLPLDNKRPGYGPSYRPESRPGYGPGGPGQKPGYPGDREEHGLITVSWQHYTVSGFPCRVGTTCAQNKVAGHWACEPEGGEVGSWDYCCAPTHRCGYSEGFHKPWCYVGPTEDQWRPCSEKYYPYHQHNIPHPSQGHRDEPQRPNRPWHDRPPGPARPPGPSRPSAPSGPPYVPDRNPGPYLAEADRNYWDELYRNGPQAYYDKYGNPLPGYSRVPTEGRPYIKFQQNNPRPGSGHWVPVSGSQLDPSVPGGLGVPRYWPVAYLHKGPPPNMTYFRYNETDKPKVTTTEKYISRELPDNPSKDNPESRNIDKAHGNNIDKSHRDEKRRNISNIDDDIFHIDLDKVTTTVKTVTTEITPTEVKEREVRVNNSEVEMIKPENVVIEKDSDIIEGIDDKLDDFSSSIEVLDIEDAKTGGKISDLKTLEAEERQIEAIGRLLASRRGSKLLLEKRSQKDLESKGIAIDKELVDFNFGNRFPTTERRGVVQKVSKDEIDRDRNIDKSLEVSETTFVRPPRVLSTTENIRKAIVNGKVFYDATIREQRDLFNNSSRKAKSLRPLEERAPSVITAGNFGKKKVIRTRNVNPVRRVKRVYRKRYNPEEVRRRLLERERSMKTENSTEGKKL